MSRRVARKLLFFGPREVSNFSEFRVQGFTAQAPQLSAAARQSPFLEARAVHPTERTAFADAMHWRSISATQPVLLRRNLEGGIIANRVAPVGPLHHRSRLLGSLRSARCAALPALRRLTSPFRDSVGDHSALPRAEPAVEAAQALSRRFAKLYHRQVRSMEALTSRNASTSEAETYRAVPPLSLPEVARRRTAQSTLFYMTTLATGFCPSVNHRS